MDFKYNDLLTDTEALGLGLENSKAKYSEMFSRFPIENQELYTSKISFQAIQLNPPSFFGDKIPLADALGVGDAVSPNRKPEPATISELGTVELFMPQAFQVNEIFSYDTPNLGPLGATGLSVAQQGGNVFDAVGKAIEQGTKGVDDLLKAFGGAELGRLGVVRAAGVFGQDTAISNIALAAAATSLNPNIRALFRNVNLREFTFQFKFIPTTRAEADAVEEIIHFFRFHAYPDLISAAGVSVGYEYPEMFRIKAYTKTTKTRNFALNREVTKYIQAGDHIKDCFLRSISVTNNPTSAVYHADGRPTEVDLTLNFVEHVTLSKRDIAANAANKSGRTTYLENPGS